MSFLNKSAAAFALTAAAAATSAAFAAGFQLTEQSSLGLGRAYAGAGIVGDDLSAVHYNPAGMTLLSGTRFQAGGVWIDVDAPIKTANGDSENGRLKGQMIPAGYTTHQVNDSLWLGFGMTVPFGMGTQYSKDWQGSSRGNESMILTFDMNPSFAWKVSEFISVGGGVSVQYAKAKLGLGLDSSMMDGAPAGMPLGNAKLEVDSWDWGYNLGVMISPTEKLRFGLSYRSSIEHNAEGTMTFSNMSPLSAALSKLNGFTFSSKATVKTPDTVMLTGTWEATDSLRLSGLVRWANWSNFKTLVVDNEVPAFVAEEIGNVSSGAAGKIAKHEIQNDWEDTWLFSVGADYAVNSNWTVRGGVAYEKDPIADQTKRMAVIPDTDRLWLTLGSTYKYNDQLQFDIGAAYLRGIGNKDLYSNTKEHGGKKIGEYDSLDAYLVLSLIHI